MSNPSTPESGPTRKPVKSLSGNVLSLKFMHRAQEAQRKRDLEEEQKKQREASEWVLPESARKMASQLFGIDASDVIANALGKSGTNTVTDASSEDLASKRVFGIKPVGMASGFAQGRKSFGNFNGNIDRLAEELNQEEKTRKLDASITRADMESLSVIEGSAFAEASKSGKKKSKKRKADEIHDTDDIEEDDEVANNNDDKPHKKKTYEKKKSSIYDTPVAEKSHGNKNKGGKNGKRQSSKDRKESAAQQAKDEFFKSLMNKSDRFKGLN